MRRWLARLSFSFLILAAVLAWEGYKSSKVPDGTKTSTLYFVAAAACFALFLTGVRERHREE
jgi:hypothetical protein